METRIIQMDPRELKLLDLNARFMRHEEYQRLVANIRQDGQLTSAPFACLDDDGKYLVLSGNHRTQASIAAGLETIPVIVTDDKLNEEQRVAIQLSHNAIVGQDDPFLLKKLYDKILDINLKEYSGLDDKTLEMLDKVRTQALSEANLEYQTLMLVFLPDELAAAQQVIDKARSEIKDKSFAWLARMPEYDRWLDAQEAASSAHNIKNVATAIDVILRLFERNIHQLSEAWEDSPDDKHWVPIESVIGRTKIPAGSAKVIRKALDKMVGSGDITTKNLFQGLEYLCADYLAGPEGR